MYICRLSDDEVATWADAISKLLIECATKLADTHDGPIPQTFVDNLILRSYTTRESVEDNRQQGWRYLCLRDRELLATAFVSKLPDVILGYSSTKYVGTADDTRWWPRGYHSVFNLAVRASMRRRGIARLLLEHICADKEAGFGGSGLCSRVEPHEGSIYGRLNFTHLVGNDVFFDEESSAVLPDWAGTIWEFNSRYIREPTLYPAVDLNKQRLKHFTFVRPFAAA